MTQLVRDDIRNVAIIAHVDHGKTTLVDQLLKQSGTFRANQQIQNVERIMDSNDLERERGITILAKNTAINYKGVKINIIDTPGHADFGGEVERVLKMADGVLLLVDAAEGTMPQTRFVLRKALSYNLRPLVVINKIDRPDARCVEVLNEVFDLFVELNATDEQLDFMVLYASGREGFAKLSLEEANKDITPLLDAILHYVPKPNGDPNGSLQMQITSLDYNDYVGRIGIGRIFMGSINAGQQVTRIDKDGKQTVHKVVELFTFTGLGRQTTKSASAGDIVAITGIENIDISDTIASLENPQAMPKISIDEPTLSMIFSVNNSPFSGRDGKYVTSRNLRERLYRELRSNVALKVEDTETPDAFRISGRGLLHLSVLIENMRREGYEMQVSKPKVIFKELKGEKAEPIEYVVIDVPKEYEGQVISLLGARKGEMLSMDTDKDITHFEFKVPSRGLIGLRNRILSSTRGEAVMYHNFYDYEPYKGDIAHRIQGVLISMATGEATTYALDGLLDRGIMFVKPSDQVYEGMIVGEHCEQNDITVNVIRAKKATNIRCATAEKGIKLPPPREFSLEMALEYIEDDELVEITPKTFRLRKKLLTENERRVVRRQQTLEPVETSPEKA
ncbi:MAG: translational GTPase TypA [Candidatus Jettenia sp.]|uniref:Large ribosomal subunit assembly factor BipA n=1 Tax=Candidatus Jettenia caeni TaxID=247490 RepID=I3IM92_9BACT|nr:translational GTPase TypA [Candidatus Jettenia sp. AMX1]MBC6927717.1 translational GTPase TypA [Candidatus Jettenia sp.]NUN22081.1 translational GTPase TypA [Candidatus Jettenia caeni]KAA0251406.1 MAG: translational GTPase TypA [Candidatus Jettenia sp. AMX1]MCE7879383.1 translational GTPase TypA [Candidatus Jettenia sp. AMX1]MDL1938332.1 translational GTPase TypA [Candidatus Jettenia sp. AMX1]